jgi:hypothetical protein
MSEAPPVVDLTDLQARTVADLLRLHANVLDELRRREILRSSNGPSGDYGEILFSRAFGWELENNAASGHDATDRAGVRYQIKCRRVTARNPSRQLSFIRKLPSQPFDVLAGVILDQNFRVIRAALVPYEVVNEIASFVSHVNAWRVILRDSVWSIPGVQDVTSDLVATETSI